MTTNYEEMLPVEQWQQVLVNVSPVDLCSVMLTSRYMNSVASWPDLWKHMEVNMGKVRDNGLEQLYSIERYKKITKMDFSTSRMIFNDDELERMLNDIHTTPLEDINFNSLLLGGLPADLLARAITRLHTVNLSRTRLTTEQCVRVISSNTLVNLSLECIDLSGVPADLLRRVVLQLHNVSLICTYLTTDQCIKVLEAIISSNTLVDVNLDSVDLSGVPADLLARAVSRFRTVNLRNTDLTTDQCVKVLEATISFKVVNVNFNGVNISGVPADLLARAVSCLHTVYLCNTSLTTDQCVKVLEATVSSKTLANVDMWDANLSGVPAELLVALPAHVKVDTEYYEWV